MKNPLARFSMESNEAVQKQETEIVIYSKITEPARLEECSSREEHVQLETNFINGQRCRVRKVTKDGKDSYTLTMKVKSAADHTGVAASTEYSAEIDEDFFNAFEQVAVRKLVKTRYKFSSENVRMSMVAGEETRDIVIPNIEYEVDVYKKTDGNICEWCKIDVEVDNILNYVNSNHKDVTDIKLNVKVSQLPFAPNSSILSHAATDEQRIKIDEIQKEYNQLSVEPQVA